MKKCTLCIDRIYNETLEEVDRVPACVSTCPVGARDFGDLGDPSSAVSRLVAERQGYDLMPELGYKPVNKYLPPRPRKTESGASGAGRDWRAVSQWRSSWLSREGVAALATYPAAGLFALGWVVFESVDGLWSLAALASILGAIVTTVATAMIYRSLRTIQRWHNEWVVPVYLALALMTGALLVNALAHLFQASQPILGWIAVATTAVGWGLKAQYWRFIDSTHGQSSAGSATGLGGRARGSLFAPPHTAEKHLLREMGFQIARKHALKLRRIATVAGFLVPLALSLAALTGPPLLAGGEAVLAAIAGLFGVVIERWLFFAEAKHSVTLYYGAELA